MTLKLEIQKLKRKDGKINTALIRRDSFKNCALHHQIIDVTSFIGNDCSLSERFYLIENDFTCAQLCPVCNAKRSFSPITNTYYKTCGNKSCSVKATVHNSTEVNKTKQKNKKTKLQYIKIFSTPIISKSELIEKIEKIGIDRIRTTYHTEEIAHLVFYTTNILPVTDDICISKRYYHLKTATLSQPTCFNCGNTASYINSVYGYRETCGAIICRTIFSSKTKRTQIAEKVKDKITKDGYTIIAFDYLNSGNPIELKCAVGHIFSRFVHNGLWNTSDDLCPVCTPSGTSTEEKFCLEEIKKIYKGKIKENYKFYKQKELDIFIPEFNLGIEYNGVFWHSYNTKESNKDKTKHLIKMEEAAEKGIRVINISSLDFNKNKDIFLSRIQNIIGGSKKIYARMCSIKELDFETSRDFFNRTHSQGNVNAKHAYGLYFNDMLVAAMSFIKNRFGGDGEYELLRYSTELNCTIVGGASRLFTYFRRILSPTSVISYSLRDWGSGNLYKELGFIFKNNTTPNYFYYKGTKIIKRYSAQKHKLKKMLDVYCDSKPEYQNMFDNGYRRYWDCGSTKWIWTNTN